MLVYWPKCEILNDHARYAFSSGDACQGYLWEYKYMEKQNRSAIKIINCTDFLESGLLEDCRISIILTIL